MTPQLFLDLADGYRSLLAHYAKPGPKEAAILIHDSSPEDAAVLKHVGSRFSGPARYLATEHPRGWDDVDIKHVIDAAYFLYRDPRLRIGNPAPVEGDGSDYGRMCQWLSTAFDD